MSRKHHPGPRLRSSRQQSVKPTGEEQGPGSGNTSLLNPVGPDHCRPRPAAIPSSVRAQHKEFSQHPAPQRRKEKPGLGSWLAVGMLGRALAPEPQSSHIKNYKD